MNHNTVIEFDLIQIKPKPTTKPTTHKKTPLKSVNSRGVNHFSCCPTRTRTFQPQLNRI